MTTHTQSESTLDAAQKYLQHANELRDLAIASQQGDTKKHADLLVKITPMIRSIIRRKWWGDAFSHEDLVQDVLLIIHTKLHTYNPAMPIIPWVRAITQYRILDQVRQYKRKDALVDSIDDQEDVTIQIEDSETHLRVDNMNFVIQAMERLTQQQAMIVYMLKVQGFSIEEVSNKIGISQVAVKVAAHRAYKKLAQYSSEQLR